MDITVDSTIQIMGCINSKVDKKTGLDVHFPGLNAFKITKNGLALVSRLDLDDLEFSKSLEQIQRVGKDDVFASATECRLILTRFANSTFEKLRFVELGEGTASQFFMRESERWIDAYTRSLNFKFYCYDKLDGAFVMAEFIDLLNKGKVP